MPSLYAEIDINAPQSVVWEALLRKDQWRYWNTFLYDCDPGLRIARGGEIFLAMQRLEGDEETEFQPLITMVRPPYMMRWVSTIPGLRSEHIFELRENVPGRTHYIHRELFSGILSKVFLPFIRQDERQGLRRMAQQLKMYVENSVLGDRYPNQDPRNRPYYDDRRYGNQPYNPPPDRGGYDRGYPRRDPGYPDPGYRDPNYPDYGRQNDYPPDYPREYPSDYPRDYPRDYPPDYPPSYDPRRR
ncbi:SRPBCC domain-containing protein [cf. Phormidesmis sp. LEGE 11477]|uniref:SRPBCC domain-containing protein n=1 Tax=cf. Phormidesmis sp. LEGE 11477 TaxID=1828680 RepID=UPI001882BA54|nr:SRPBCC domain-containing protein [cf. Phormidesmis sp. LEGE 11477]MBE9060253.1 SRPBCC domain-containing protein [cf. Phormidesmis sp. LEGE 11477]